MPAALPGATKRPSENPTRARMTPRTLRGPAPTETPHGAAIAGFPPAPLRLVLDAPGHTRSFRMVSKWWTRTLVCVAAFMLLLDITIVKARRVVAGSEMEPA